MVGGVAIILVTLALGPRAYNGLSLPLLQQAFTPQAVPDFAFACKLLLTALTLGVGFKGGEVTPLFVIGATLGATLGRFMGVPIDLMAALGFIAVFAATANTPLACLVMGVELFGSAPLLLLGIATCVAYACSGHRGIYLSQRILTPKRQLPAVALQDMSLRDVRRVATPAGALTLPWLRRRAAAPDAQLAPEPRVATISNEHATGGGAMQHIQSQEYGLLRIYMRMEERLATHKRRWQIFSPPMYRHVIGWARAYGLPKAMVKQTLHGYVQHGAHQGDWTTDVPNPRLNIHVELAGALLELDGFVRAHTEHLHGYFMIYKQIERWDLLPVVPVADAEPGT